MAIRRMEEVAPTIGLREAKEAFDRGTALFVDVRRRESYERSRIPGAIAIPIQELARHIDELPRDRAIIFY